MLGDWLGGFCSNSADGKKFKRETRGGIGGTGQLMWFGGHGEGGESEMTFRYKKVHFPPPQVVSSLGKKF